MKPQSPEQTKRPPKAKTNTYLTLICIKKLLIELERKPRTQPEIVRDLGLCGSTVSRWLNRLHVKPGLVYIHSWTRTGTRGCPSAVWGAGFNCFDAPRPAPLRPGVAQKLWRARKAAGIQLTSPQPGVIRHVTN